jgi:hypothetical protein
MLDWPLLALVPHRSCAAFPAYSSAFNTNCRDFSNGFLFAEILCRYYPADVQMHSFENVTSIERKRANWVVLERLFKVNCCLHVPAAALACFCFRMATVLLLVVCCRKGTSQLSSNR